MHNLKSGPIAWMARHKVAANILMIIFLFGGFFFALEIKKEVFPDSELDSVRVSISYPGATPEEIEKGIVLSIEDALSDVLGIKKSEVSISEGGARFFIELESSKDRVKIFQDIKDAVNAISTFPDEMEEPKVTLSERVRRVLTLSIFGDVDENTLRANAELLYDALIANSGISRVEMEGIKDFEIKVNISKENLKKYNLSIKELSDIIKTQVVELSGGTIKNSAGEVLIRYEERADYAKDLENIIIRTNSSGSTLKLKDIATLSEGFSEEDSLLTYNGKRSIAFEVYRVGNQTPIEVSDSLKAVLAEFRQDLPEGVEVFINNDLSDVYRQRLELLLKNALIGLLLVFLMLGAFLEMRLAFWVVVGIPTSFLGAFLFLPWFDVSINMVSMFAFIVALGIVVDDAIIAGENIYEHRQKGESFLESSIAGAKDIATPLSYAIITNIIAFTPLLFMPGMLGKIFMVIPIVVSTVFIISWIEALFILPNHLAYSRKEHDGSISHFLYQKQQKIALLLEKFVDKFYRPTLDFAIKNRYIVVAFGVFILLIVLAYAKSGRMGFTLMPIVESDRAVADARLPVGSTMEDALKIQQKLISSGLKVVENIGGDLLEGYRGRIDENSVRIDFYLRDADIRPISTGEFIKKWRESSGKIAGVDFVRYKSDIGGPGGGRAALNIELSHRDVDILKAASSELSSLLADIGNTSDIEDGFTPGKREYRVFLNEYGKSLGVDPAYIAREIRASFNGLESIRFQRERNEVRVKIYIPEEQRDNPHDLYYLDIKLPNGSFVPLSSIATLEQGHSYSSIIRSDGRRIVSVKANVDPIRELPKVVNLIDSEIAPALKAQFAGLSLEYGGRQADTKEGMNMLMKSFVIVLVLIYIALAIPFGSYSQPLIVMVAIPFGVVGALIGHSIMDYGLSLISVMGIVALSGVVVNDTLVLIDYANKQKIKGYSSFEAIKMAGIRRFRPVFLTTITTFGGLAPMIFETSIQARFMIPMAISLGYGILFATFITLILIPSLYMILEDLKPSQIDQPPKKSLSIH